MDKKIVIALINESIKIQIANIVDNDLEKVLNGTHEVKIRIEKKKRKVNIKEIISIQNIEEISNTLKIVNTREEGIKYLNENLNNKLAAEKVARYLHVSYLKQDKKEYIINKITEATIGARLRSIAIKGEK